MIISRLSILFAFYTHLESFFDKIDTTPAARLLGKTKGPGADGICSCLSRYRLCTFHFNTDKGPRGVIPPYRSYLYTPVASADGYEITMARTLTWNIRSARDTRSPYDYYTAVHQIAQDRKKRVLGELGSNYRINR